VICEEIFIGRKWLNFFDVGEKFGLLRVRKLVGILRMGEDGFMSTPAANI
jgi:hypothetical protein